MLPLNLTVYSKKNCQPCKATIRKLTETGLPFSVVAVDEDPAVAEALRAEGWLESPVVKIDGGRSWSGYRPDELGALARAAA
jgi:glutaredoxin-like protein NrdH